MTIAEKQLFDPLRALEERTAAVDVLVLKSWAHHFAKAAPGVTALLAVGGYGRRQLFPYSDVDLLLLFANDKAAAGLKDSDFRISAAIVGCRAAREPFSAHAGRMFGAS